VLPFFNFSEGSVYLYPGDIIALADGGLRIANGYAYTTPSGDTDPGRPVFGGMITGITAAGALDETYGEDGYSYLGDDSGVNDALLKPTGDLLLAGSQSSEFDVSEVRADGMVVNGFMPAFAKFDTDEKLGGQPLGPGYLAGLAAVPDGRLIGFGTSSYVRRTTKTDLVAALIGADGELIGGLRTNLGAVETSRVDPVLQPDGRLLAAANTGDRPIVLRYPPIADLACEIVPLDVHTAQVKVGRRKQRLKQVKRFGTKAQIRKAKSKLDAARKRARDAAAEFEESCS